MDSKYRKAWRFCPELLPGFEEVNALLHVEPKVGRRAENMCQPHSHIGGNGAMTVDDLVHGKSRHGKRVGQSLLRDLGTRPAQNSVAQEDAWALRCKISIFSHHDAAVLLGLLNAKVRNT